jgi:hypothetical protein
MNSKISRALSDTQSGDITSYFNEVDQIIQLNDGVHDNKILSMECYDRPTPVQYNGHEILRHCKIFELTGIKN